MEADNPGTPVVAILGPTGVGKSALALTLAEQFEGEIVSADSRQVYRMLDIGTAKATPAERARIRHHVIDVVDPDQTYTVVDFLRDAREAIIDIGRRERVAVVVGGTGYYARALLQGLTFPDLTTDLRRSAETEREVKSRGVNVALEEIALVDPATADRLDSSNPRRVARALETIRETGKPIPPVESSPIDALVLGLSQERDLLYRRIDKRVDQQVQRGLIQETAHVLDAGYSPELPVLKGLAYGEMIEHLSGKWTQVQAINAYKSASHRLARRQLTWFRREPRIEWLDVDGQDFISEVEAKVRAHLSLQQTRSRV